MVIFPRMLSGMVVFKVWYTLFDSLSILESKSSMQIQTSPYGQKKITHREQNKQTCVVRMRSHNICCELWSRHCFACIIKMNIYQPCKLYTTSFVMSRELQLTRDGLSEASAWIKAKLIRVPYWDYMHPCVSLVLESKRKSLTSLIRHP